MPPENEITMKRRSVQPDEELDPERGLYRALLALRSVDEMRAFFRDLCTPAELEALADRWAVVPFLERGMPYREIHDHTGVSVTTIGRVARYLAQGNGGYRLAADRTVVAKRSRPGSDSSVVGKRALPAADRSVVAKRTRRAGARS
jgi:TrpR-related protein YerC/YecD